MLKNIVVIIILGCAIVACNNSDNIKKPDNLISKAKMSNILYDLYIINAAKGANRTLLETNGFLPEAYILSKYSIDSMQFVESNFYYSFNEEAYKSIVEKVKQRLEKEKLLYEDIRTVETKLANKRRDSIRNSNLKIKDSLKILGDLKEVKIDTIKNL